MSSGEKLRFGIFGCGVIGPHHARVIAGLDDAQLVAVADVNPGRAEDLASQYGCSHHAGLWEMLAEARIDDDELRYFHAADGGDSNAAVDNQAEGVMRRYGGVSPGTGAGSDPGSLSMVHRDQIQDLRPSSMAKYPRAAS